MRCLKSVTPAPAVITADVGHVLFDDCPDMSSVWQPAAMRTVDSSAIARFVRMVTEQSLRPGAQGCAPGRNIVPPKRATVNFS
jgi:hypothetical protein